MQKLRKREKCALQSKAIFERNRIWVERRALLDIYSKVYLTSVARGLLTLSVVSAPERCFLSTPLVFGEPWSGLQSFWEVPAFALVVAGCLQ